MFPARGVTGADTLVGQTTAELVVRKDFFVDIKVPPSLTQGDKPRFIGQIHHVGIKGNVEVKLSAYAGENEQVYPKTLEIKGDGIDEIVFEPFEVPDSDNVRLTLTATVGQAKDELVTEVPVRPWGVQAFGSASGTASNDATVFVGLPVAGRMKTPKCSAVFPTSAPPPDRAGRWDAITSCRECDDRGFDLHSRRCRMADVKRARPARGDFRVDVPARPEAPAPEASRLTDKIRRARHGTDSGAE